MIRKTLPMIVRALFGPILLIATVAQLHAEDPTIRVLFFTGDVTVTSGKTSTPARIGQTLSKTDVVVLKKNATVQLSLNGKVIKYAKPAKLKMADVIKRAGTGENAVVANSVRTLAAASGAARESRTSRAGATRLTDSSSLADAKNNAIDRTRNEANAQIGSATGIDDPLGKAEKILNDMSGPALVVLEPRSTAVSRGPIRFRWLHTPGVERYILTVKNYLGDELFRTETSDTTFLWEWAALQPDAVYTWTLGNVGNPLQRSTVTFHQLNEPQDSAVRAAMEEVRKEIADEQDPALMLLQATIYSDNGCYGEAARLFTACAMSSPQHFTEFMDMAREEYRFNMFIPEEEVAVICGK
jgi:hypothetical protein